MPRIEVEKVCKSFGSLKVLKEVSFRVDEGEYVVVLGPSGCGKTTLLKTIVGLYRPDSGRVLVDGVDITEKPTEERGIGFFFQHYALFPHMTVRQNVGYGLEMRGLGLEEVGKAVDEKLRMVGLSAWAGHYPHELSGGMQQRVALARSLAIGSKLLLLDEPLNALDAKIAAMLRKELKKMAEDLGLTVLHVTPNQSEAMELADKLILIKDGAVVQVGSDFESYTKPNSPYAAYFIGESNFLKAKRVDTHTVRHEGVPFAVKGEARWADVLMAVRPEKILFERHEGNTLRGVVESINFLGKTTRYEVNQNGRFIHVETSKHPNLKAGDAVYVHFPPDDIMLFDGGQAVDEEINVI